VLYWDETRQLLYVNSSDNDSLHEGLARAVAGEGAVRITGENVYRVMGDIARLVPTNVGLLDVRSRFRRFSMHVGADVIEGFPIAEAQTKTKTNIFAYGYEGGSRVSIGASLKGRIWSYRVASTLKHWVDWCDGIGAKLMNATLNVDDVMRGFIRPEICETRPQLVALALEWDWSLVAGAGEGLRLEHEGSAWPLLQADLQPTAYDSVGPLPFRVTTPTWQLDYELEIRDAGMHFRSVGADAVVRSHDQQVGLGAFLASRAPTVLFERDAMVIPPGMLLRPPRDLAPFDRDTMQVLDWTGIDLAVESQGQGRRADSIQARMIRQVLDTGTWDIVIDDDGPGEIADIVALRVAGNELIVRLVHCKYVDGGRPRGRVEDLYEVLGQAEKSARWRRNVDVLLRRLIEREKNRLNRGRLTGLMHGDGTSLYNIADRAHLLKARFTIAIAQPGMSKGAVSDSMLELLASAEVYVREIADSDFGVFCSA
jgi:hypothetical protein